MNDLFEIATSYGQFYYNLFYFLALGVAGLFFMIDGRRKKYPMAEWSLIFATGIIFLIIGSKVFTYLTEDWRTILATWTFPYTEKKTVLGGIIGLIFGMGLAKKLIRFPHPVLDSFAVSLPLALAVQGLGCFVAGCCFGSPTDMPWAVSYSPHAYVYYSHLSQGLIDPACGMSAPIHPIQLYQSLLCVGVAFIVWRFQKWWRRPGNLFFTSIGLYWMVRFVVEFWRSNESNGIGGAEYMGIKYLQWILLGGIVLIIPFIIIRERMYRQDVKVNLPLTNPVWAFMALCVFVLMAGNWFTKTEFLTIEAVLTPTLFLQIARLLKPELKGYSYRLASVYALMFVLIGSGTMTGQKIYDELTKDSTSRNTFNDISLGYGNFKYSHYHSAPSYFSGCDYSYYTPNGDLYKHDFKTIGIGFNHVETYGVYKKISLSGSLSGGWDTDENITPKLTTHPFDISGAVKYDLRGLGFGIGLRGGQANNEDHVEDIFYSTDHKVKGYTNLTGNLRLGAYDVFYVEYRYNEMFPYQMGHRGKDYSVFVLGSGLNHKDGSGVELGFDVYGGIFFSVNATIQNKYRIAATVFRENSTNQKIQIPRIALTYRFTGKHWNKPPTIQ